MSHFTQQGTEVGNLQNRYAGIYRLIALLAHNHNRTLLHSLNFVLTTITLMAAAGKK